MNKTKIYDWFSFFAPRFILLSVVMGIIVRITLILHPETSVDCTLFDWVKIFAIGLINDIALALIALIPAFIFYTFLADVRYKKPFSYIYFGVLLLLTLYVVLFNDITDEYAGVLPRIVNAVLIILTTLFALKLFIPSFRKIWKTVAIWIVMLLYVCILINVAIAQWVFWDEFGVRFNFIAVDYLVYTHEVIGNIFESYPMIPIIGAIVAIGALICFFMLRKKDLTDCGINGYGRWFVTLILLAILSVLSVIWLRFEYRKLQRENVFATEIQRNGEWCFVEAFLSSELDYSHFYKLLPEDQAKTLRLQMCGFDSQEQKQITDAMAPIKKNIVLITVESLSGSFLARYGGEKNITPSIDTLIEKSLVFDNLYANGNRTVRGLEALTLSIPPSSGESLVKRPFESKFFSVGDVLREQGYSTTYIYGGDSYFDNMGAFYSHCGYDVFDKFKYDPQKIEFANIWGTSDEDTYREALGLFDKYWEEEKPFFAQIMTISNHRPYTYPEGRISGIENPKSREAAVKYSDWAIGDFITKSWSKPWFKETIFIVIADHCASSAGKISLPLDKYHIPALVYAPGFIEPQIVEKVCSQIDVMPTLFSLLHFSYTSPFYGANVLAEDFKERAFMATYQDLGYYKDDILTILSPVRRVNQYKISRFDGWNYSAEPLSEEVEYLIKEAQAYYQGANELYD